MKLLAANGDMHWQYYLGLVYVGVLQGETNIPEGLVLLTNLAKLPNSKPNVMRYLGQSYKKPSPYQNHELAYQWLYLASQHPDFKDQGITDLPDAELSAAILPQRRKELETSAKDLLQNR